MKLQKLISGIGLPLANLILISLLTLSCDISSEQMTRDYGWFDFVIPDYDTAHNVVDMSFLNEKEAGATGFISVKAGHFVTGAGDPIRFFGDNLTFRGCFQDKDTSTMLAARFKKIGYNVIRFHHMDMRSTPSGIWNETIDTFDPEQVDKLDWLIFQLKKNGIYTNLNLHVSRIYPGVDYGENRAFVFGKRIDHFYRPYIEMQKEYARMLLTHENPYTGNTYANEPAVGFVEVNNENSILSRWTALSTLTGDHRVALAAQWRDFLKQNGKSVSWDIYKIIDNFDTESTPEQKEMFFKFLVDTELSYAEEMVDFLKNDIGIKMPVSVSQASYSGMVGVYREAKYADFIDMHAYWQHPRWLGRAWDRENWMIGNSSMVADKRGGTLIRFSQHRVKDMPLTISEYDHPAPSFYCAEMYPVLNAVAAFQDWDGIYHFNYNPNSKIGEINGYFSASGHPLKQVFIPVGAVLFRMPTISTGSSVLTLNVPESDALNQLVAFDKKQSTNAQHTDYVWKKAGWNDALTVLRRTEVAFTGDALEISGQVPDEPDSSWVSETGEIFWNNRDSAQAVFTVNAPAAKAAVGYIGGKTIELGNVVIAMDSTETNWGTVTLTSLDAKPLEGSSNVLLVVAGRAENTGMGWNEAKNSIGTEWGAAPTIVEGIPVKVSLLGLDKFKLFKLDPAGNKADEVNTLDKRRTQELHIGAQHKTLWYLLTRE
jgi:hypothetical protein